MTDLIVRAEKIPDLLREMRGKKEVAALTEQALSKLALDDPHLRVEGISLARKAGKHENQSGLVIKVTEIRDGESRATLFLGDIEAPQQQALFDHPEASRIFENVRAVTLPHHGRKTTLSPDFFSRLKEAAGSEVIALHSDRAALDSEVQGWARQAGIEVRSTAPSTEGAPPEDVYVNLFDKPTYLVVKQATTITSLSLERAMMPVAVPENVSDQELAGAISAFTERELTEVLPSGYILSLPTGSFISSYTGTARERLIGNLKEALIKPVSFARRIDEGVSPPGFLPEGCELRDKSDLIGLVWRLWRPFASFRRHYAPCGTSRLRCW
jgi:hypothetical protein